jgi:hypothetical protein
MAFQEVARFEDNGGIKSVYHCTKQERVKFGKAQ